MNEKPTTETPETQPGEVQAGEAQPLAPPDPAQPESEPQPLAPPDPVEPEPEPQPLAPPDPAEPEPELQAVAPPDPVEPEAEPFSDGPPPLPQPMLVLGGNLPPDPAPAPVEEVDHGTCRCGGSFDAEGWCTQCGERKPDPRHHFSAQPTARVAAVCDRGVRHTANEDAMAVWGEEEQGELRAAVVVCDGVTTATRSAEASLAASYAALEVMTTSDEAPDTRLARATDAAAAAVDQVGRDFPDSAPSCTFVAAVVEDGTATVGNVGDSRAYWLPDDGEPLRLTRDDSLAEEQIQAGIDRATAEASPLAHTITRWLGPDSPEHAPRVTTAQVTVPGWLLLCSDGLWNYASEPADLRAVLRAEQQRVGSEPLQLGQALVAWANAQGGVDNITVALVRTGADTAAPSGQDGDHG